MQNSTFKYYLLGCLLLLTNKFIFSQAVLSIADTLHDFGKIKEADGMVSHTFNFTNAGTETLVIQNVKTPCGCTVAEWPKISIAPSQSGIIKLTFNPKGIRGKFFKKIRVFSNSNTGDPKIYLSGEVIPMDTSFNYNGPFFQTGSLKFSTFKLNLDTFYDSEIKYDSVLIINAGPKPVLLSTKNTNDFFTVKTSTAALSPGENTYLVVSFDPLSKTQYGSVFDKITINTDDSIFPVKNLSVKGYVMEDFSLLSDEEIQNAPLAVFESTKIDLGDLKKGEKKSFEYTLSNNGNSDLFIRNIKPGCGCTVLSNDVKSISPMQSAKIKFIFTTEGKTGLQEKKILVILNDPKQPNTWLFLTANVLP